jgi:hypothetical protein
MDLYANFLINCLNVRKLKWSSLLKSIAEATDKDLKIMDIAENSC